MEEGAKGRPVSQISVDEFAEATVAAVLRGLEARPRPDIRLGPIVYGIIAWPEGFPEQFGKPQAFGE
jgi:hypothetical protein